MTMRRQGAVLLVAAWLVGGMQAMSKDTLPPIQNGAVSQTVGELWADYDPRTEPLDVEVLKEWEEDGIVFKVLRYRVGIFKGEKAMMAAVYGYPKGGTNLPGLVQIHGGGQYAHANAVRANAKRGYATISIAWAGRISAPDYQVGPEEVKLFWDGATNDPNYKLTTDWGAIDAYHAPCRYPGNNFTFNPPSEHSIDPVASPRNSAWFPGTMAARRALTFLEQQPEVDANRLGVYGHSMGGKLTVLTAGSDDRVKAAAPSCGGISDRQNDGSGIEGTLTDEVYLKRITCPIMFLSPANDFHGRINDLQSAVDEIRTDDWRVTCAAHHNHQDTAEYEVATLLWMDQHLKGTFSMPQTTTTELTLATGSGIPLITVFPDESKPVLRVDVYYTVQGVADPDGKDRDNTGARFWHYAATEKDGAAWTASLPLPTVDKPLWVYANVIYALDPPVSGAGYYYGEYTADRFNLSSRMAMISPDELAAADVRATMEPSLMIEPFADDWEKEWFTYRSQEWGRLTHKLHSDVWRAPEARLCKESGSPGGSPSRLRTEREGEAPAEPEGAVLAFDVRAAESNRLVVGLDKYAVEIEVRGGSEWQSVRLSASDFHDATGNPRTDWKGIRELRLVEKDRLNGKVDGVDKQVVLGGGWKGAPPEFRDLRWIPADAVGANTI